jgi:hypothetical protein
VFTRLGYTIIVTLYSALLMCGPHSALLMCGGPRRVAWLSLLRRGALLPAERGSRGLGMHWDASGRAASRQRRHYVQHRWNEEHASYLGECGEIGYPPSGRISYGCRDSLNRRLPMITLRRLKVEAKTGGDRSVVNLASRSDAKDVCDGVTKRLEGFTLDARTSIVCAGEAGFPSLQATTSELKKTTMR